MRNIDQDIHVDKTLSSDSTEERKAKFVDAHLCETVQIENPLAAYDNETVDPIDDDPYARETLQVTDPLAAYHAEESIQENDVLDEFLKPEDRAALRKITADETVTATDIDVDFEEDVDFNDWD